MQAEEIGADSLPARRTMITGFMCELTEHEKTYTELLEIFARDQEILAEQGDPSNDLRVIPYEADMLAANWADPIVFVEDQHGRIVDGIHRGIAYLRCIQAGMAPKALPRLLLARVDLT